MLRGVQGSRGEVTDKKNKTNHKALVDKGERERTKQGRRIGDLTQFTDIHIVESCCASGIGGPHLARRKAEMGGGRLSILFKKRVGIQNEQVS